MFNNCIFCLKPVYFQLGIYSKYLEFSGVILQKSLNILSIISSDLYSGPGVPALEHLRLLKECGHNVQLVCKAGKNLAEKAEQAGIKTCFELNLPRNGQIWQIWEDSTKLKAIISGFNPDLIFTHKTIETLLCGIAVNKKNIPVIRIWHDGSGKRISTPERIMHNFSRIPIIATSLAGEKAVRFFAPTGVSPVPVLRGGVDTEVFNDDFSGNCLKEQYNLPEDAVILGIISRFKEGRGLEDFLSAFAKAALADKRLYAVLLGKGELLEILREKAEMLGVADKVLFYSAGENFVKSVQSFDIGVLMSPGSDGSARAVFEMMSCSKPVVLFRKGSLSDFEYDNEENHLAVCKNTDEISNAVKILSSDKNLREKYGKSLRKLVKEKYSKEVLQDILSNLCLKAVNDKWHL